MQPHNMMRRQMPDVISSIARYDSAEETAKTVRDRQIAKANADFDSYPKSRATAIARDLETILKGIYSIKRNKYEIDQSIAIDLDEAVAKLKSVFAAEPASADAELAAMMVAHASAVVALAKP